MIILSGEEDLAKLIESDFPDNPLCRLQGASREPFATAGSVTERERVGSGIEADLVGTRMSASAIGTDIYGTRESRRLHSLDGLEHSSRRSVLFRIVMDLPSPGAVLLLNSHPAGHFRRQAKEDLNADREVGTPNQRGTVLLDRCLSLSHMREPSGGADDGRDAQSSEFDDVGQRHFGRGEFDGDIDSGKVGRREALASSVVEFIQLEDHLKAILGSELLNEPPHFSVTDQCEFHAKKTAGSRSAKNSPWRALTACSTSESSIAKLTLRDDAP